MVDRGKSKPSKARKNILTDGESWNYRFYSSLTSRAPAWGLLILDLPLHTQVEIHVQEGIAKIFFWCPLTAHGNHIRDFSKQELSWYILASFYI